MLLVCLICVIVSSNAFDISPGCEYFADQKNISYTLPSNVQQLKIQTFMFAYADPPLFIDVPAENFRSVVSGNRKLGWNSLFLLNDRNGLKVNINDASLNPNGNYNLPQNKIFVSGRFFTIDCQSNEYIYQKLSQTAHEVKPALTFWNKISRIEIFSPRVSDYSLILDISSHTRGKKYLLNICPGKNDPRILELEQSFEECLLRNNVDYVLDISLSLFTEESHGVNLVDKNFAPQKFAFRQKISWENPFNSFGSGEIYIRMKTNGPFQDVVPATLKPTTVPSRECNEEEYRCRSSSKCIPRHRVCDGYTQCDDRSDEFNCESWACLPSREFQCHSRNRCIPRSWVCDGKKQCDDNSDEEHCTGGDPRGCLNAEFKCKTTNQCIPRLKVCDGQKDCADNSDEQSCDSWTCSFAEFQCKSTSQCVPMSWLCNGEPQCPDLSDELFCDKSSCKNDEFLCKEKGRCIPQTSLCDGRFDCNDRSDEQRCTVCLTNQFRCHTSKRCIPRRFVCDGRNNCADKSDEQQNCKIVECASNEFKCSSSNECISSDWVCDGIADCRDETDEKHCGCGVNPIDKEKSKLLVGAKTTEAKNWPWMASLFLIDEDAHFCGGTLISDKHVLTAAHCFDTYLIEDVRVRLAEYNMAVTNESNHIDMDIAAIKRHEDYDSNTIENDIAILTLSHPTIFNSQISRVCLPPPGLDFTADLGFVIGWGRIHFEGPVSDVLQLLVIPVWEQSKCVAAYPDDLVSSSMMCAGSTIERKTSCQGDSGGPLLVQIPPESQWYVAGIVSWNRYCALYHLPSVFTRVNHYLPWIQETVA